MPWSFLLCHTLCICPFFSLYFFKMPFLNSFASILSYKLFLLVPWITMMRRHYLSSRVRTKSLYVPTGSGSGRTKREQDRKHHRIICNGQGFHFLNKLMSGYSLTLVRSGINPMIKWSPATWFRSGYVCDSLESRALALFPASRDKAREDKAASLKMQECKGSPTVSKNIKIHLRWEYPVLLQLFYECKFPKECLLTVQK